MDNFLFQQIENKKFTIELIICLTEMKLKYMFLMKIKEKFHQKSTLIAQILKVIDLIGINALFFKLN
jgi:hypothetical protein